MKLFYASLPVLLLFAACTSADKKENLSMTGAYDILSVTVKSDSTDTTYTSGRQLKIYTGDGYMMYANINTPDSASGFGIATYSAGTDTVTENVFFNAFDSVADEKPQSFQLGIEKTGKGYKQVINDMTSQTGEHYKLTEDYQTVGTDAKSPLDGAWKQVKAYDIKGKDTTVHNSTQYKTYFAGYVIWGHTYADSLKKNHTGVGFGKFEMKGADKIKESMIASTYYQTRGNDFDIDIELKGTDEYTQTMILPDSTKAVEVYARLKK